MNSHQRKQASALGLEIFTKLPLLYLLTTFLILLTSSLLFPVEYRYNKQKLIVYEVSTDWYFFMMIHCERIQALCCCEVQLVYDLL